MFFRKTKKPASSRVSTTHKVRTKRGKKRYYPKSSLRRKIKSGMKRQGYAKRARKQACTSGWW